MASFGQLTSSKEFQDLPREQKIEAIRAHWDAAELAATNDEQRKEFQDARELTLGGIEAWGRADNIDGNQSEDDRKAAEEEAKRYDAAWALYGSGQVKRRPEAAQRFNDLMGEINGVRESRQAALRRQAESVIEISNKQSANLDRFKTFLNEGGFATEALQSLNSASGAGGLVLKPDGSWETPVIDSRKEGEDKGFIYTTGRYIDHHTAQRSNSDSMLQQLDSDFPAALQKFQQESGMSPQEIQTAWSDFNNENRKWQEGEGIRTMSDGSIRINPAGAASLDEAKLREQIQSSGTTDIQKRIAIAQIPQARVQAASELMLPLMAWSAKPWREDFGETATKELKEGKDLASITNDYIKRNKVSGIGPETIVDKLAVEGSLKVAGTVLGAGGAITGNDALTEASAKVSEASNIYSSGESAMVGPRGMAGKMWAGALAEAPSLAVMLMLTKGAGLAAGASTRALTVGAVESGAMTPAAAAARTAFAVRGAALITSTGTAGVQSMGMTYSELASKALNEGKTVDEAHEIAAPKAYRAGLATSMITGAFGLAGLGGLESAASNMTVRDFAARAAASGVTAPSAAKAMFSKMLSKSAALTGGRAGAVVKGGIGEFGEEALDQFVGVFINADPDQPIVDAFEQSFDAGMIGLGIGGFASGVAHRADAKDPSSRTAADRAALRRAVDTGAGDIPTIHEMWVNDSGDRVGLTIEGNGLMSKSVEQDDGSWLPDEGGAKSRSSLQRELAGDGFFQSSGIQFDDKGQPSHSILIDEAQGKAQSKVITDQRDATLAQWQGRFDRREQERRDATAARRAQQIEEIQKQDPATRRAASLDLIDNLVRIQRMRNAAPDTAEAAAAERPEAERQAGLFDYVAVAGADEAITAPEGASPEVAGAVATLAKHGIATKNDLAINLNSSFTGGDPATNEEIAGAAQTLIRDGVVGGFGVLPEGIERNERGELFAVSKPETPAGSRTPEQRAAYSAATGALAARITELDTELGKPEPKGRGASKAKERRAKLKVERDEAQAKLDALRRERTNETRAARGLPPLATEEAATDVEPEEESPAEPAPPAVAEEAPAAAEPQAEPPAVKKARRTKAKAAQAAATEATAEVEAAEATAAQAAEAAIRARQEAEAASNAERARLAKAADDALAAAKKFSTEAKAKKPKQAAAKKAVADSAPAPAATPPAIKEDKARDKFIEQVEGWRTNLGSAATLKSKADTALSKGWISKADHDEIMRISKEQVAEAKRESTRDDKVDPDLGDAWDHLIGSLEFQKEQPQGTATPTSDVGTNEARATPEPAAEAAGIQATPVDGVEQTGSEAPAPVANGAPPPAGSPAPAAVAGSRLTGKALGMANIVKGQLEKGIADGTLTRIKKGELNNALMEDLIGDLVESGAFTFPEIAPLAGLSPESMPAALLEMVNDALGIPKDQTPAIQQPRIPTAEDTNTRKLIKQDANPAVNNSTKGSQTFKAVQNKEAEPKPSTKRKAKKAVAATKSDEAIAEEVATEVAESSDPNDPSTKVDPVESEDDSWGDEPAEEIVSLDDLPSLTPEEREAMAAEMRAAALDPLSHANRHKTAAEKIGGLSASPTLPSKAMHKMISQIQRRFGLKVLWKDLGPRVHGRFTVNRARIELNSRIMLTADTPLHEVAHALCAAVRAKNPQLWSNMLEELDALIDTDPALQRIRNEVIDTYNESNEAILLEETMVAYLSKNAEAMLTDNYWADPSKWESKSIANKAWAYIRDMLGSIFSSKRASVATISQTSTLNDIAALLVDPETRLDLTKGDAPGSGSPRTLLLEHAIGIKAAAQAVLDSLHETTTGLMAMTRDAQGNPQISITISDGWAALSKSIGDMIGPIKNAIGGDVRHAEFAQRWLEHKSPALDDDFWRGYENLRSVLGDLTGRPVLTHEQVGFVFQLLSPTASKLIAEGNPDFDNMATMLRIRDSLMTTSPTFVSATIARIPGSAITPMAAAFSRLGRLEGQAKQGEMVPLSELDLALIRDMMMERIFTADFILNAAKNPNLDAMDAHATLVTVWSDEHAAAVGISEATGINPLAKAGVTVSDYVARRLNPNVQAWANRQMHGEISNKQRPEAMLSKSRAAGFPASAAAVTPPRRFGDGTKDGLFNAIPTNKAFAFDAGTKIMPKADGTPSGPFNELSHAQSFRSVAAAKEGLKQTELRIWKVEAGGKVSYMVVVPPVMGDGIQKRIGRMFDPGVLEREMSDALTLRALPTTEELRDLNLTNKSAFRKLLRKVQGFIKDRFGDDPHSHDDMEMLQQQDELDEAVTVNKLQQYYSRLQATVVTKALQARHKGAFLINNRNINDPAYGTVENIPLKAGQSPYLSDILQTAMVDPHAYALTPAQTAMVDDMRSVLEQAREMMRAAKLDKKFLEDHGLDTGAFLSDPVKGKATWREYFPRMVQGWVDRRGEFKRKMYLGTGSTKSERKSMDNARMPGPDGKPLTMEQIRTNPETAEIVYSVDPFETLNHFLTNTYSAIAATDLAANLEKFAKPGKKATLKESYLRDVPVLSQLFDNEIAEYLRKKLIEDQTTDASIQKIEKGANLAKSIVLGALDAAAPLTTAMAFTFGHPISEALRGRFVGGFTDVATVIGTGVKTDLVPAFMRLINGQVKDTVNSVDGFDKLYKGNEQIFSEMAALNSIMGSATDYDEQVRMLQQNAALNKTAAGRFAIKARVVEWMGGLGDFHRNYSSFGKMMMWKGMRTRYVDEATGELRTDRDSVKRMIEDLRGVDRAMGYSNDMELSGISSNMKGAMRILTTAPTMYLSMGKALTTASGLKQVAPMVVGGLMFFVLCAKSAGMDDRDIYGRMDPRHKDFLKMDVKLPSGLVIQVGMSSFYKSIATLFGKEVDAAQRAMRGEVTSMKDFSAPVAMFGRSRTSPFIAGVVSMITNEDFMGRECSALQAATSALVPASINEPLSAWANRLLGLEGTPFNLASNEDQYTVTEKQKLSDTATIFAGQFLGLNIYGERESHAINSDRNKLSRERMGIDFDDIPPERFKEGMKIIDDVAKQRGSVEKFGGFDYIKAKKEQGRIFALRELPPELRRMVAQSGLLETGELEVPGLVRTPGKKNAYLTGTMKAGYWRAAANDMITKPNGLRAELELQRSQGIPAAKRREEIKKAWNESTAADNSRVHSAAGITYR